MITPNQLRVYAKYKTHYWTGVDFIYFDGVKDFEGGEVLIRYCDTLDVSARKSMKLSDLLLMIDHELLPPPNKIERDMK